MCSEYVLGPKASIDMSQSKLNRLLQKTLLQTRLKKSTHHVYFLTNKFPQNHPWDVSRAANTGHGTPSS